MIEALNILVVNRETWNSVVDAHPPTTVALPTDPACSAVLVTGWRPGWDDKA